MLGLKEEISSVIKLHKPRTVDLALSLALMQEKVCEQVPKKRGYYKQEYKEPYKKEFKNPSPAKGVLGVSPGAEKKEDARHMGNKYSSLKAMLRAKGLCFKCREKYTGPNHKCPDTVPLHILEEFIDLLQLEQTSDNGGDDNPDSDSDESLLCLSVAAATGGQHKKTMKILGSINNQKVLILLDSGSSSSFISSNLAHQLNLPVHDTSEDTVVIADGTKMKSNTMVKGLRWWTQGHTFHTDVRILPIGCYDIILGMDWLSDFKPMWIHWKKHIMKFTHNKRRITLKGIRDRTSSCKMITVVSGRDS